MSSGNSFLGIILGAAIGVGLGILYAPDKGSNTRKKLIDNANAAKDDLLSEAEKQKLKASKNAEDFKNSTINKFGTKKASFDHQLDTIVNNASHKADHVISTIESKLKTLKDKNKSLQTKKNTAIQTKS